MIRTFVPTQALARIRSATDTLVRKWRKRWAIDRYMFQTLKKLNNVKGTKMEKVNDI